MGGGNRGKGGIVYDECRKLNTVGVGSCVGCKCHPKRFGEVVVWSLGVRSSCWLRDGWWGGERKHLRLLAPMSEIRSRAFRKMFGSVTVAWKPFWGYGALDPI